MPRTLAASLLVALLAAPVAAQEPAPPTLDQLIDRLAELQKRKDDAAKEAEAVKDSIRTLWKGYGEKLQKLGVLDPLPPPAPPKPPEPVDPLKARLAAAFDADADAAGKRGHAKDLAALYRQAAKLAQDTSVATSGDLLQQVARAAATLLNDPPGGKHLAGVRRVVGEELNRLLPTDDPLTDAQRKAAAELFGKLATILDTLGA